MTLISSAKNPVATLLLAHGAGAPMDSPFMESLAEALADRGIQVVRFEFPYMQRRREEQRKFPPNRAPQLLEAFARQVASVERSGLPLWVGGKSMGGRMASMLAAEGASEIDGVVAFGYPFHPPGKPENTRTEHLASLAVPMLICQGERDPFGCHCLPVEETRHQLYPSARNARGSAPDSQPAGYGSPARYAHHRNQRACKGKPQLFR